MLNCYLYWNLNLLLAGCLSIQLHHVTFCLTLDIFSIFSFIVWKPIIIIFLNPIDGILNFMNEWMDAKSILRKLHWSLREKNFSSFHLSLRNVMKPNEQNKTPSDDIGIM